MSISSRNKGVSKRKKANITKSNRIKEYKYLIIINTVIALFISFVIYAFVFVTPRRRYEPRFTLSSYENTIIYIIVTALPIIALIVTSAWSIRRINRIKKSKTHPGQG